MLDFIAHPLGQFLYFIYNTMAFKYYGLAIIIFTVVVKLVLLPLTVKQYRSTAKMQSIQPQIQEIQKRYKNDKEKLNQEMMKVYQENNVNPAGGCLPLIVQMPILISLYWVIVQPLKFMLGKTPENITKITDFVTSKLGPTVMGYQKELIALNYFNKNPGQLDQLNGILTQKELINFNFLGLHLGETASYSTSKLFGPESYIYLPLLLLPIIGVITTFLSTKLSMPKNNPQAAGQNAMASSMTNSMMYIGPVMTLIFSFQLPAGVVLYWIAGYVFQIFQQLYINKHILKKHEKEEVKEIKEEVKVIKEEPKAIAQNSGKKKNQQSKKKEGKKK